jgi:hypothetical protein
MDKFRIKSRINYMDFIMNDLFIIGVFFTLRSIADVSNHEMRLNALPLLKKSTNS